MIHKSRTSALKIIIINNNNNKIKQKTIKEVLSKDLGKHDKRLRTSFRLCFLGSLMKFTMSQIFFYGSLCNIDAYYRCLFVSKESIALLFKNKKKKKKKLKLRV